MKGPYTGEPGQDWRLGQGPFFFSGRPSHCAGYLTLTNESDDKVKVRALSVCAPARKRKNVRSIDTAVIALQARIPPHSEVRARAILQLDAGTPPGLYETALVCGPQKEPLQVEVLPHQELSLEPRHFNVRGTTGDTVTQAIQLRNLGNIPVSLGNVAMVWLRERDWIGRNLVYSLRETGPDDTYEDFANRLLHNLRDSVVTPVKIELDTPAEESLAPGQQLQRELRMELPKGLKKGRNYLGFIKINEYRIWMELYCNGAQGSSKRR